MCIHIHIQIHIKGETELKVKNRSIRGPDSPPGAADEYRLSEKEKRKIDTLIGKALRGDVDAIRAILQATGELPEEQEALR